MRKLTCHKAPKYWISTLAAALLIWVSLHGVSMAQDSGPARMDKASTLYQGQATPLPDLEEIERLLDGIVQEFPASDLAVSIILQEKIQGLDVAAFRAQLSALREAGGASPVDPALAGAADCIIRTLAEKPLADVEIQFEVSPTGDIVGLPVLTAPKVARSVHRQFFFAFATALESCAPFLNGMEGKQYTVQNIQGDLTLIGQSTAQAALQKESQPVLKALPSLQPVQESGSAETESALDLDKQAIRDIQARLSVLGYDPNGIDGVMGSGTRGAIQAWQASQDSPATGYLSASHLAALKTQSEAPLQSWLTIPDNNALYNPPPPIPLGPYAMSGNWRYTTNCGASSKVGKFEIRGLLNVRHVGGNNYAGSISNSQGLRGRFKGTLSGRRFAGEVNWGLLYGRVQTRGVVADQKLAISGRDSNGCSFFAAKTG